MDQTSRPGRALGLDLGDARIGVAISDDERRLAMPLDTVLAAPGTDLQAIAGLVGEHGVSMVVIGLPRSMSGEEGARATEARAYASALAALTDTPVEMQDERLTTAEAERRLREAGARGTDRRRVVDRSAAVVILQAWLDAHG